MLKLFAPCGRIGFQRDFNTLILKLAFDDEFTQRSRYKLYLLQSFRQGTCKNLRFGTGGTSLCLKLIPNLCAGFKPASGFKQPPNPCP
jgi:hypothetical protein